MATWEDVRRAALALPETAERLDVIDPGELDGLIVDAWLAKAPKRLARTYLDTAG